MSRELIKKLSDEAHGFLCANDFTRALECYKSILTIDPGDDSSLHFMAAVLDIQGSHRTALELVNSALKRYKCRPEYYSTLASVHRNLGNHPEALEAISAAVHLRPRDPVVLSNAAMTLMDSGDFERAKEVFESALEADPENPFVHFNYSLLLLASGDLENGWKEYEWRIPFHYGEPAPRVPEDLKGKKVQIVPEQGYGDFIMFSRFFSSLEKAGASVFVSCPKKLSGLYDQHYCDSPDLTLRVASLAGLFNEIPQEPYLKAPGVKSIKDNGRKVGVAARAVKSQNNEARSVVGPDGVHIIPHPANLAYKSAFKRSLPHDFFDHFPGKLYNLQPEPSPRLENLEINDFSDLADYVDQMDLVIAIDTAVAHLAGAMGKETWLLLPYDSEWRWQRKREDSYWYPSIRIFRQPSRGDWTSVQEMVFESI